MQHLRFSCGHGAPGGSVVVSRACPICQVLTSAGRTRASLQQRLARSERARFAVEVNMNAEYTWVCRRGHDRYRASIAAAIDGDACPKCRAGARAASAIRQAGAAGMNGARMPTSQAEQRLRALLEEQLVIPRGVNRIRIARTFHGRNEVWPDIIIPALKIAIEYDSPGRGGDWHRGLREASDLDKDAALRDVGWEVIRVRTGGLEHLGRYSIQASGPTHKVAGQLIAMMEQIRGVEAVDQIKRPTVNSAQ